MPLKYCLFYNLHCVKLSKNCNVTLCHIFHSYDSQAVELSEARDFAISKVSRPEKLKSHRLHLEKH